MGVLRKDFKIMKRSFVSENDHASKIPGPFNA